MNEQNKYLISPVGRNKKLYYNFWDHVISSEAEKSHSAWQSKILNERLLFYYVISPAGRNDQPYCNFWDHVISSLL